MTIQSIQSLIDPINKEIQGKTFVISKVPVVQFREISVMYSMAFFKKFDDYKNNELTMLKLLSFAGVPMDDGKVLMLSNEKIINSHITSLIMLTELEVMMIDHSIPDFQIGRIFSSFKDTALNFQQKATETLTGLSAQLSQKEKQPLKNSEQSTH